MLIALIIALVAADVNGSVDSLRNFVFANCNYLNTLDSSVRTVTHDLTVSGGGKAVIDSLLSRRGRIDNLLSRSLSLSSTVDRATIALPEYTANALSVANDTATLDDIYNGMGEIYLKTSNIDTYVASYSVKIADYLSSANSLLYTIGQGVADFHAALKPYCDKDGYLVKLSDVSLNKIQLAIDDMVAQLKQAIKDGSSSKGSGLKDDVAFIDLSRYVIEGLGDANNILFDINNTVADWYRDWTSFTVGIAPVVTNVGKVAESLVRSLDMSYSYALENLDDIGLPIVRVVGNFGSPSNTLEYTEKFYRENYDGLDNAAKKLFDSSGGGFRKDFSNIFWPGYRMSFPVVGFQDYDDTSTNTPSVTWGEIYSYDGLTQLAEILWQNLRANANAGIIQTEILKALRGEGRDVAEDEYTEGLTDLENDFGSEDGWRSHFTNTVGVIESFRDKFSGKVDSSAIDTISSGFVAKGLPSSLSFIVPSYTFGSFTTETQVISSPSLEQYRWVFDGIRNFFIFLWWSAAVGFVYALARVVFFCLSKFIADPVSVVVQRD